MKKKTWNVGSFAECNDCDWRSTNNRNAHTVGEEHARHHNHFVRVETTIVSYYNYSDSLFRSLEAET